MVSNQLFLNNSTMDDVVSGIQALSMRAQERLQNLTTYAAQLPDAAEGQTLPAAEEIMTQAKAYFNHVVDSLNSLAAKLPAAIQEINLGDQYAAAAFSGGGLGGSTAV
jgi:uncharacterized protein YukE